MRISLEEIMTKLLAYTLSLHAERPNLPSYPPYYVHYMRPQIHATRHFRNIDTTNPQLR